MAWLSFVNKLLAVTETCSSFPVFHETVSLTRGMKSFVSCSFCATLKTIFAFIDSLQASCFCMSCRCFGETGSLFRVFIHFIVITVQTYGSLEAVFSALKQFIKRRHYNQLESRASGCLLHHVT